MVWETTSNVDYGFDAGFFDNRLELSVTGYNKLTSDRLYDKALPAQTGFSSIKANLGTVQNKGFELSLTAHPLSTTSRELGCYGYFQYEQDVYEKASL